MKAMDEGDGRALVLRGRHHGLNVSDPEPRAVGLVGNGTKTP